MLRAKGRQDPRLLVGGDKRCHHSGSDKENERGIPGSSAIFALVLPGLSEAPRHWGK